MSQPALGSWPSSVSGSGVAGLGSDWIGAERGPESFCGLALAGFLDCHGLVSGRETLAASNIHVSLSFWPESSCAKVY